MAQPAGPGPARPPGDPSMEDILASIREILSDDEAAAKPGTAPVPVASPADPADVLLLNEDMMVPDPAPAPTPPLTSSGPDAPDGPPTSRPADPLVAPAAAQAAASSLGALVRTVAQERSVALHRGGPTLEDIVRDEIRPILKEWLDANLPPLVERLVRAEIDRVAGHANP